jgi:hypothetical protein
MCDENNIIKCGPEGKVVQALEEAFIKHCESNILSEDCKEFYNKEYKINDFVVKLNRNIKENKKAEQKNNACRKIDNIYKDDCINFANDNVYLQGYIASICSENTSSSKEVCNNICNNDNSNDILKKITCEYDYISVAIIIIISVMAVFLVATIVFYTNEKKASRVNTFTQDNKNK